MCCLPKARLHTRQTVTEQQRRSASVSIAEMEFAVYAANYTSRNVENTDSPATPSRWCPLSDATLSPMTSCQGLCQGCCDVLSR